jgi:hypothetical protein
MLDEWCRLGDGDSSVAVISIYQSENIFFSANRPLRVASLRMTNSSDAVILRRPTILSVISTKFPADEESFTSVGTVFFSLSDHLR